MLLSPDITQLEKIKEIEDEMSRTQSVSRAFRVASSLNLADDTSIAVHGCAQEEQGDRVRLKLGACVQLWEARQAGVADAYTLFHPGTIWASLKQSLRNTG